MAKSRKKSGSAADGADLERAQTCWHGAVDAARWDVALAAARWWRRLRLEIEDRSAASIGVPAWYRTALTADAQAAAITAYAHGVIAQATERYQRGVASARDDAAVRSMAVVLSALAAQRGDDATEAEIGALAGDPARLAELLAAEAAAVRGAVH